MKRPVRKTISFLAAMAMCCSLPIPQVGAAYTVEQIGKTYSSLFRCKDFNMFVEGGDTDGSLGERKLLIVDNAGKQRTVKLDKGVCGIYPYCSSTMGAYNFLSPTPASYSFDFFDPAFQIGADEDVMIVETNGGKYALGDLNGKLISSFHDLMMYISDGLYLFADSTSSGEASVGILASDGTVMIAGSTDIKRLYLTMDGKCFLVKGRNGDYFCDLNGKPLSDVYDEIDAADCYGQANRTYYYWHYYDYEPLPEFKPGAMSTKDWSKVSQTRLTSTYYRFKNGNGKYAVSFGAMKPNTDYFTSCDMEYYETKDPNTNKITANQYICLGEQDKADIPGIYYDMKGNLLSEKPQSDVQNSLTYNPESQTYFEWKSHELRNYSGQKLITLPDECYNGYRFDYKNEVYYVGQANGYFMVFDSTGKVVQEHLDGIAKGDMIYTSKEDTSVSEEKQHYGIFSPEKGTVTEPVYDEYVWESGNYKNDEGKSVPYKVYVMAVDGKLEFYDINLEKKREFAAEYEFEYRYNEPLFDLQYLILNCTIDGNDTSVWYDAVRDEVRYTMDSSHDSLVEVLGDYMIVADYEGSDPAQWTDDTVKSRTVLQTDGKEVLTLDKNVLISLKMGYDLTDAEDFENVLDHSYYQTAESDENKCFICLRNQIIKKAQDAYYEAMQLERGNYDGVVIDPSALDMDYASANHAQAAVRLSDGSFAVLENGKWRLDGTGGKSYDMIYSYQDGLAVCSDYIKKEITEKNYYPDINAYKTITAELPMQFTGVIDKRGRELVKPFYEVTNGRSYYSGVAREGDTIYVRKPIENEVNRNQYLHYSVSNVFNEVTEKYGYDTAEACDDLYEVCMDGKVGLVTAQNQEVLPVKYSELLHFTADRFSLEKIKEPISTFLSSEELTSPLRLLGDRTKLVCVKTVDGQIEAFRFTQTTSEDSSGDVNSDGIINSKDAALILIEASKIGIGGQSTFSSAQKINADVNGDGIINAKDAAVILRYAAGVGIGKTDPIDKYI